MVSMTFINEFKYFFIENRAVNNVVISNRTTKEKEAINKGRSPCCDIRQDFVFDIVNVEPIKAKNHPCKADNKQSSEVRRVSK